MATTKLLSPAKNCKPRYAAIGSLNHQPAINYIFNASLTERQQILHTVLSLKTRVTTKVKLAIQQQTHRTPIRPLKIKGTIYWYRHLSPHDSLSPAAQAPAMPHHDPTPTTPFRTPITCRACHHSRLASAHKLCSTKGWAA